MKNVCIFVNCSVGGKNEQKKDKKSCEAKHMCVRVKKQHIFITYLA